MTAANSSAATRPGLLGLVGKLHQIKLGGDKGPRVKRRDLAYLLRNVSTLVENGLSLPRALATLARERSLKRHAAMIDSIRRHIEAGESFSGALARFPGVFNDLMVQQVRVGERAGTVAETLDRLAGQIETANQLKAKIIKRLSYPAIVFTAGVLVVAFMLLYVVPQFEETFRKARVPLPGPTRLLMAVGSWVTAYGWLLPAGVVAIVVFIRRLRRREACALWMDRKALRLPLVGHWLRDIAVLQFMDVMGNMMESGFKVIDALSLSVRSIGNRAVSGAVAGLRSAVERGERLSHELEKHGDLFRPLVSQLVIVGEQTGQLGKSTRRVREHLRSEIERKADNMVGLLEPMLTIGLALAIAAILLAMHMPMFGMVVVSRALQQSALAPSSTAPCQASTVQ